MNSSTFQYLAPLDQDQEFFRLLDIIKRDRCGLITCRLFPVKLSQTTVVSYTAISYTWEQDTPNNGCLIAINEQMIRVQRNVHDMLESLHASGEKAPIFIDALCIDQSSIQDKNTQVAQMGKVYYNASKVVVWFGRIPMSMQRELDVLLTKSHVQRSSTTDGRYLESQRLKDSRLIYWIATHPYWRRLWIVQEMMLAQDVTFRASATDIEWRDLVDWFDLNRFRKGDLPLYMERASNLLRWR